MAETHGYEVPTGLPLLIGGAGVAAVIWQTVRDDPGRPPMWHNPFFDFFVVLALIGLCLLLVHFVRPVFVALGERRVAQHKHVEDQSLMKAFEEERARQLTREEPAKPGSEVRPSEPSPWLEPTDKKREARCLVVGSYLMALSR